MCPEYGHIAQLAEHLAVNQGVVGSSPAMSVITAGWSSPEARLAHTQKVGGSNPSPATNEQWLSLARALDLGSRGRGFESCLFDY